METPNMRSSHAPAAQRRARGRSQHNYRTGVLFALCAPLVLLGTNTAQAVPLENGWIDTSAAPSAISVIGPDNWSYSYSSTQISYTHSAAAAGNWSFSWAYSSADLLAGADGAGWLLNNVFTLLSDDQVANPTGVSGPIAVNFGDTIGFRVYSQDNLEGPGTLQIMDFSAPAVGGGSQEDFTGVYSVDSWSSTQIEPESVVPEPTSLALLALGAVGMAAARRRRASL